jgi:dihydroorotate dehydrogenase (fumarate)
MMDLSTTYLGLKLSNPLMPGASPLADDLSVVRQLEDAGAAAIVMRSMFEEQLSSVPARPYYPWPGEFSLAPDAYLEHVRKLKEAVDVPVIASMNGTTSGAWLSYSRQLEQAGADALELNFYYVATDASEAGADIEARLCAMVRTLRSEVSVPVAVKLTPFVSSLPNLARQLEDAGADGLVLFSRFSQPDIDPDVLEAVPRLTLSTSDELLLRVRWLAILSGRVRGSLGASGGVHSGLDALKAVLAGAHAVQMVSALLLRGPMLLARVRRELAHWLEQREYESLRQALGVVSLQHTSNPDAFERGHYLQVLQSGKKLMS